MQRTDDIGRTATRGGMAVWLAGAMALGFAVNAWAEPTLIATDATPQAAAGTFSFETVIAEAQALAAKPYDDTPPAVPRALEEMTYDQFRRIVHDRSRAVWANEELPFRITFFHRGWLHKQRVDVSLVTDGKAEPVPYHREWFEYRDPIAPLPEDLGFAGLRILYPLNQPDKIDELAAFLGASYFRPLAKGQHYGLSIRGLAIDTGLPTGEEFPAFIKYWLVTPAKDAKSLTMYALLDSKSITGAYEFVFHPGEETLIDIDVHLFPRTAIQKLGIAPLTSMYLYGESDLRPPYDFRPEVHDSDGLLVADNSGEWMWRPLANPRHTRITQYITRNIKGFGLLQRDRHYTHYEDLESMYNDRPSAWIEPIEGFGAGRVDLLEIASDDEGMDNIVAAYVADAPVEGGQRLNYKYRLRMMSHDPASHTGGKVLATRRMWRPEGFVHKTITVPPNVMRFLIDFDGPPLDALDVEAVEKAKSMELVVTATNAAVGNRVAHFNPVTGTWRAFVDVTPEDPTKAVDIRAFLKNGNDVLTETWSYSWNP